MVNDGIQVDASRCFALFRRLDTKNQRKVSRAALRAAANKVKKQAVKNLQGVIGHNVRKTTTYTRRNGKTEKRSLARGIKVEVMNPETAKVHIMGDYRLKWFEMGTQPRTTKGRRTKAKKIPMRRASGRGRIFKETEQTRMVRKGRKSQRARSGTGYRGSIGKTYLKTGKS